MATDYDAPRKADDDTTSIEEIKESAATKPSGSDVDMDEGDVLSFAGGPDIVNEDLEVLVLPEQEDEFTCSECFIVKHHSQLANSKKSVCIECAS